MKSKGGNRAHPPPVKKVKSGRVSKHHKKAPHGRVSTPEVPEATKNVRQETQNEFSAYEITDGEDDAYEDAGTDKDCSERSGSESATEMDTPTRLAVEKRMEAKKKRREKITIRRLESSRDSRRNTPYPPSTRPSSSVGRSSPCVGRTQAVVGRRSPSARPRSSPPPSSSRPPSPCSSAAPKEADSSDDAAGPSAESIRGRKNLVTGGERILLDSARDLLYDYTLFGSSLPSAPDLTAVIHEAWAHSQEWKGFSIEPSAESLSNVSTEETINVQKGTLNMM